MNGTGRGSLPKPTLRSPRWTNSLGKWPSIREEGPRGRAPSFRMCTHAHVHACIHAYTHTHAHTSTQCMHACMHTTVHTRTYTTHAHTYSHARTHTHTNTHIRARTHTRVHTHAGAAHRARRSSHKLALCLLIMCCPSRIARIGAY